MIKKFYTRRSKISAFLKKNHASYSHEEKGAAIIEFAIIMPVLVLLLVGMVELYFYMDARTKVQRVASSIAKFTSYDYLLSEGEARQFFGIAEQTIYPFDVNDLTMGISVWHLGKNTPEFVWGEGTQNASTAKELAGVMNSGRQRSEAFECPYVIVGSVNFRLESFFINGIFSNGFNIEHDSITFPRIVDQLRIQKGDGSIETLDDCKARIL